MLAEAIYDGRLSGTAWLILAAALVVIVGGLCWCFYRAAKAAGAGPEKQLPDDQPAPGEPPPTASE